MIRPEIVHPRELAQADARAWRAVQAKTPEFDSPLLGPEFARAVGEVREDARVAIWRGAEGPVGFLPFHERPNGFARPIGAPFCDYHALVSAPDFGLDGAEALLSAGLGALRLWAVVDPFGAFREGVEQRGLGYRVVLPGDGASPLDWIARGGRNRLKNYRRARRKLEAELGPLRIAAPDHDSAALETLLAWKAEQTRRSGLHDFLRPPWAKALMRRLFETRTGDFQGLMISLYAGDKLVAGHFGVRSGGVYHPWISAIRPDAAAYSPGFVHQWMAIEAMPVLGLGAYDLGPGEAHWKRVFAQDAIPVGAGLMTAPNLAGRLAGSRERVWRLPVLARLETAARLRRRLDYIAAIELTAAGRARGVIEALAGAGRRAASRAKSRAAGVGLPNAGGTG